MLTSHFGQAVTLKDSSNGQNTAAVVNEAFATLISTCIERNLFKVIGGRHSELFAIPSARYPEPVYLERYAATLFGITCRGAHLVAYTMTLDQGMKVWVPRRSAHLFTYPGMLDTSVAGGVKAGSSPLQTIIEEADEEASLPEELVRQRVRSRGVVTHVSLTGKGFAGEQGLVVPDYIYVYDMELPSDVIPKPHDDEVSDFTCMAIPELQAALLHEEFKPDSAAVLVDFLITHGIITAENEKDFVEISMRLHRRLPFRTG
jgi:8-oxo-dGTP pyrophosphatase MutT (NUDIX family)